MRHFSDALTDELIVSTMTRAISALDLDELTDTRKRLAAYERAAVASEHIRDFDALAIRSEAFRRGITPAPRKRTA